MRALRDVPALSEGRQSEGRGISLTALGLGSRRAASLPAPELGGLDEAPPPPARLPAQA